MNYVKVNNNKIVKYPYTWDDLCRENPYTNYDSRFDLVEWYSKTNEAIETGNVIKPVKYGDPIECDEKTQYLRMMKEPVLINDEWVLSYILINKTKKQINASNLLLSST